jgi:hypothetical protein
MIATAATVLRVRWTACSSAARPVLLSHSKCAWLRWSPDSEWHCAMCSRPSAVSARLAAAADVVPALASAAVAPASPLSGAAPAPVSPPVVVAPAVASFPLVLPVQSRVLPPASSRRPSRLRGSVFVSLLVCSLALTRLAPLVLFARSSSAPLSRGRCPSSRLLWCRLLVSYLCLLVPELRRACQPLGGNSWDVWRIVYD